MKRILKIIILGICLGLAMVVLQNILKMDTNDFMHMYWMIAIVIILAAVLINVLYNLHYQQKVQKAAKLLEAGKTNEYIDELKKLLKTAKGSNLRNVLSLNLAAGYLEAKEFDMAIPMLEELAGKRLTGAGVKTAHRINLCMCYFDTEQYDKAAALYNESQRLFEQYRNSKSFGANIIILDIFMAVHAKQYEQANALLETARKTYDTPRYQQAFCEITGIITKEREIGIRGE